MPPGQRVSHRGQVASLQEVEVLRRHISQLGQDSGELGGVLLRIAQGWTLAAAAIVAHQHGQPQRFGVGGPKGREDDEDAQEVASELNHGRGFSWAFSKRKESWAATAMGIRVRARMAWAPPAASS